MLNPTDRWVWDFWHAESEGVHHLFYLQAPKVLGDPHRRHRHATIAHATSMDLRHWTEHGTIVSPGSPGSDDETATWTGSVARGNDGLWRMFYTGAVFLSEHADRNVETILMATSEDLFTWRTTPGFALRANPTWYETIGDSDWPEEAWRDPWVYRSGDTWHMLITARRNSGGPFQRGVVGHATSNDLDTWTILPPLPTHGAGFEHLEVPQRVYVPDRGDVLLFSAHDSVISPQRRLRGGGTGSWVTPWGPTVDLEQASNLTGPRLYSARIIQTERGAMALAFALAEDGATPQGIIDPIPLTPAVASSALRADASTP